MLIVLMMAAVSTSEMSVNLYQTTRGNIPEDSHLLLLETGATLLITSSHLAGRRLFYSNRSPRSLCMIDEPDDQVQLL
jgi:hypothetical protein